MCIKVGQSMLRRMIYQYLAEAESHTVDFDPVRTGPPVRLPAWANRHVQCFLGAGSVVSDELHCYVGCVRSGYVVWLSNPFRLGKVRLAIKSTTGTFHLIVTIFSRNATGAWIDQEGETVVAQHSSVYAVCHHVVVDGKVYV
jgi:hypothetical protein